MFFQKWDINKALSVRFCMLFITQIPFTLPKLIFHGIVSAVWMVHRNNGKRTVLFKQCSAVLKRFVIDRFGWIRKIMAVGTLKCVQQACYICLTPECIEPRRFLLLQVFENVRPKSINCECISIYALFFLQT